MLYVRYEIKGVNLDRLINYLQKSGVSLYDIKKFPDKRLRVSVNFKENQKFFAIIKDLCYTDIVKIKTFGFGYPIYYLYTHLGMLIGSIIFILILTFFSSFVCKIEYVGSGNVLKPQVESFLLSEGITPFTRIDESQMKSLAEKILKNNPRLSFVSCKKDGSVLYIDLALSKEKNQVSNANTEYFYSTIDGEIESFKVYKGTFLKQVGDTVSVGELLVEGYMTIKEQRTFTGILAFVTLKTSDLFVYESEKPMEEDVLFALAEGQIDGQTLNQTLQTQQTSNGYKYIVKTVYRHTLYVG